MVLKSTDAFLQLNDPVISDLSDAFLLLVSTVLLDSGAFIDGWDQGSKQRSAIESFR